VSFPSTSVLIVNYNAGGHLRACVESVLDATVVPNVIVVDNNSTDGSLDTLIRSFADHPSLTVICNDKNDGFARACNTGIDRACSTYLLFLNPDCIIKKETIEQMIAVLEQDPSIGLAGCLIQNPDGSEQAGCRRRIPTPWLVLIRALGLTRFKQRSPTFAAFELIDQPLPEHPIDIDAISGAFMFVRRAAIERVGNLDDGYFLHAEDLDWCIRFRKAGYRVVFVPHVSIVHNKGVSSRDRPIWVEWHKHRGMARLYNKFLFPNIVFPAALMIRVMIWIRFALVVVRNELRAVIGVGCRNRTSRLGS